jgi:uncharacterized protein YfiM (DUF2279 family)
MPPTKFWQVITMLCLITAPIGIAQPARAALPDDKVLHFGAGMGLGAAGYGVAAFLDDSSWIRASSGLALGAAIGGLKEWIDHGNSGESSPHDFLATVAGAALSAGLLLMWDQLSPYKDEEKTQAGVLPSSPNHETDLGINPLKKLIRTETSHEPALSERIPGHAFQTRPKISSSLSPSFIGRTLHGPRRALSQHQLFLY